MAHHGEKELTVVFKPSRNPAEKISPGTKKRQNAKHDVVLHTGYADKNGNVECIFCHNEFPVGEIERHLIANHDAEGIIRADTSRESVVWVHILQGGAPA